MSYDPEDSHPEPQLDRKFTFKGKPLAPYSMNHRAALQRCGRLTDYEFGIYLVRILLLSDIEVDAIRDEQVPLFRIESSKWAEREKVSNGPALDALDKLVDEIIGAVNAAEEIQPAPKKGAKKKQEKPSSHPAKRPAT